MQAGADWKACVKCRVHSRPVRLDKVLVLNIIGAERVRIQPNTLHDVVHTFLNVKENLLLEETTQQEEDAPSTTVLLQPGTYFYPFRVHIPAPLSLPTMHFRHDRGPTGISAYGRDMACGSVHYEATVRCSSRGFPKSVRRIQVLPSAVAAPWQSRIAVQATEVGGGRIFWGAAVDENLVFRDGGEVRLYISLVNESTAKIKHLRVELVETVSLCTKDANYLVRKFPEVLWRLEHAPLDDLETGCKMAEHLEQTTEAELQVSSRAVLDDLEQHRPQPIAIQVPRTARPSHVGQLTRTQHELRLTLLTNKKSEQLMVPLWIV